jgi:hypothetical protein
MKIHYEYALRRCVVKRIALIALLVALVGGGFAVRKRKQDA